MATQHNNWSDGFAAIRARAENVRGVVEDDGARWPKTTNGDVIAIASIVDPELKTRAIRFRDDGLGAQWRAIVDDLDAIALTAPDPEESFAKNREFWSVVGDVCAYLDDVPVPELWSALADHLGDKSLRNSGPKGDAPFVSVDGIATFDGMWKAQHERLIELRGFDKPDPPAGFGMPLRIPRTTNSDVLQLATYWSEQLAKVKQVMGYKTALEKWQVALSDVDKYAGTGKPDDVYAKNNEFWHATSFVSIQIAVGDEAPSKWDLAVDIIKETVMGVPHAIGAAASKGVDLVADAGHAAGRVVNEVGRGLFSGFGAPFLVGGALLGVYLLTRSKHEPAEA